jgi:hypothetical protein
MQGHLRKLSGAFRFGHRRPGEREGASGERCREQVLHETPPIAVFAGVSSLRAAGAVRNSAGRCGFPMAVARAGPWASFAAASSGIIGWHGSCENMGSRNAFDPRLGLDPAW